MTLKASINKLVCLILGRIRDSRSSLKVLLFHAVQEEINAATDQALTCSPGYLHHQIDATLAQGRRFIHAEELPEALLKKHRVAMLTFDDGYANNRLILPFLSSRGIPATIFVTTDAVVRNTSFWWDVLARESRARNLAGGEISQLRREYKRCRYDEIERRLLTSFGQDCLRPRGEADRPMTADELAELSRDPLVTIGNHTHHHVLLPQYSDSEVRSEIALCSDHLHRIIGRRPTLLAYPNGRWNERVAGIVREMGFQHAFTTERAICPLPLRESRFLTIPRVQPA